MKRVLITGGTGYIGSHTAVEFIEAGYEVLIVDDLSNSQISVLDGIEQITGKRPKFFKIDMKDEKLLSEFFEKEQGIDIVIHFAAHKFVGESVDKPLMYYKNNMFSLINLLSEMIKHKISNVIFSSSCTVYGTPEHLPVTEKTPVQKAASPYGNTKQIAEEIIEDTVKANTNLRAISLRYFNPIGAHKTAIIGELPTGVPNNLIPYVTQTVAGLRNELSVFGNDYDTPDGTAIRDYIHVTDLAKAHLKAAERLLEDKQKAKYEVFNVGTGNGNSVMEVINTFERVNGLKVNYKIVGRRSGDINKIWADTTFANNELGWKAELSLEQALKSAWEWEKKVNSL